MANKVSETLDTIFYSRSKRSALLTPWERQEMANKVSETLDNLFAEPAYDKRLR
jgi:uncharacterized PurR-regulated membrane protein YhhQ (DUF165 family)